jgi:hypothetical protein
VAGAAACSAQRSDGGGGTFHFVLAVLVFSTSRATISSECDLEIRKLLTEGSDEWVRGKPKCALPEPEVSGVGEFGT